MTALHVKAGIFAKTGTTSGFPFDQSITGVGFQPKCIIFWTAGTGSGAAAHVRPGFGFSTGPSPAENLGIHFGMENGVDLSSNQHITFRHQNPEFLTNGTLGSISYRFVVKSLDADGFTLEWHTNTTTTQFSIFYLAIGGTDVTDVKAGSFNWEQTTQGETQDVTSVGFEPDMVFFVSSNLSTGEVPGSNPSLNHAVWSLGAAKSSTEQGVIAGNSVRVASGNLSQAASIQRMDRCIALFNPTDSTALHASINYVQSLSNGFRLNLAFAGAEIQSNRPVFYLAIKGGNWKVGSITQPTTTGVQSIQNQGFEPKGLFLFSNCDTVSNNIRRNCRHSIGAASATDSRYLMFGGERDDAVTTIATRGIALNAVARLATEQGTTLTNNALADLSSFSASNDGTFSLNWTQADSVERQLIYVAAGDSEEPTPGDDLVKLQGETVGSTEVLLRALGKARVHTDAQIGLQETTLQAMGKVKVVGGFTGSGFTESGFTESGFVTGVQATGTTTTADFEEQDFVAADFIVEDGEPSEPSPVPPEGVGIAESVIPKITVFTGTVTAENIVIYYSGGTSNSSSVLSLGGTKSTHEVQSNVLNAAWDDVEFSEATDGHEEYRCFYLVNEHPDKIAYNVKMWIDQNTGAEDHIEIAEGASAIDGTEPALDPLEETTVPAGTGGFTIAPDEESAIMLGDLPADGGHRAFWEKRVVPEGAASQDNNQLVLRVSFVSDVE